MLMVSLAVALQAPLNVLVFSRTTGFRHDSIETGVQMVRDLGQKHGFTVEATEDPAQFNDERLRRFQVVIFLNTTGDVLNEPQQLAFEKFMRSGRGYVGIHSAADTEYDWPFYAKLVGAQFKSHPQIQPARVIVEKPKDPCCAHLPEVWERTDEWYCYRVNPRPVVQVLGRLDVKSYSGSTMGDDHPIFWKQEIEGARSFYTGMGHTKETYAEPLFQEKIFRALKWAAKRL